MLQKSQLLTKMMENDWQIGDGRPLSDETKKFHRDRYRDFFLRPNIYETDTVTFFRDQMFLRLIPRLFFETDTEPFFETKCFRD